MKRDLDLIRDMLLKIEESGSEISPLSIEDFLKFNADPEVISYHLYLLFNAGFINVAYEEPFYDTTNYFVTTLTMHGCDYLDAVRDVGIWHDVKEKLKAVGGPASLDIVKAVAIKIVASHI